MEIHIIYHFCSNCIHFDQKNHSNRNNIVGRIIFSQNKKSRLYLFDTTALFNILRLFKTLQIAFRIVIYFYISALTLR